MERKIVSSILIFGVAVIFVLSFNAFDLPSKFSAFAQTSFDPYPGPIPEDNSTDPTIGPIPEDNGTDPTMVPDPMNNSTDMQNPNPVLADTMPGDNMTGPLGDNMSDSLGNTSSQTSLPVPDNAGNILSPLEQVKSGVQAKDVQCKQGFTLIIKVEDGSAACVYPQVVQILAQRGW